jgi:hemolysin-activating ACP:hemolysin acyltransferase
MNDLYRIVHLYRQFPKYDKYTYEDLVKMLTPSVNLDQYQIHRIGNEDVGFTNWAYLSDTVEQRFKLISKIKANEWNCGDNIWVMQFLAKRNALQIFYWVKDYFKEKIQVDKSVKWLRTNNNHQIYRRLEKHKREFHIHA